MLILQRRGLLQVVAGAIAAPMATACGAVDLRVSKATKLGEVLVTDFGWEMGRYTTGWEDTGVIVLPPGEEVTIMDPGFSFYPAVFLNGRLIEQQNPWVLPIEGRIRVEIHHPYSPSRNARHTRWLERANTLGH